MSGLRQLIRFRNTAETLTKRVERDVYRSMLYAAGQADTGLGHSSLFDYGSDDEVEQALSKWFETAYSSNIGRLFSVRPYNHFAGVVEEYLGILEKNLNTERQLADIQRRLSTKSKNSYEEHCLKDFISRGRISYEKIKRITLSTLAAQLASTTT